MRLLINIDTGCSLLPSISRFDTFFSYLPCITCFDVSYLQSTKIKNIRINFNEWKQITRALECRTGRLSYRKLHELLM